MYYCHEAVHSITDWFVPLQSGSVFYQCAKLTDAQYQYIVKFTLDGKHGVIFTLDDCITIPPFTGGPFWGLDHVNTRR